MTGGYRFQVTVAPPELTVPGTRVVGFRECTGASFSERILPRPSFGILLDCTPESVSAAGAAHGASGLVGGMAPHAATVTGMALDCLEIQLSPLVARALLDVPPAELDSPFVALDDLWGRDAERLRSRLLESRSWTDRFVIVSEALTLRMGAAPAARHGPDPVVADAWRRLVRSGGRMPVGDLAAEYGVSRTRFWSRFRSEIGVGPKQAARIVRFDRAMRLIGTGIALADVAAEAGYADQPHLNRDFVDLAAMTPGTLRGEPLWSSDLALGDVMGGGEHSSKPPVPRRADSGAMAQQALTRASLPIGLPRARPRRSA